MNLVVHKAIELSEAAVTIRIHKDKLYLLIAPDNYKSKFVISVYSLSNPTKPIKLFDKASYDFNIRVDLRNFYTFGYVINKKTKKLVSNFSHDYIFATYNKYYDSNSYKFVRFYTMQLLSKSEFQLFLNIN